MDDSCIGCGDFPNSYWCFTCKAQLCSWCDDCDRADSYDEETSSDCGTDACSCFEDEYGT